MARQSQGYDSNIAVGLESVQGTAPADAKFDKIGIVRSFEPEENKNHEVIRGLGSRKAQMIKAKQYEITSSASLYLQNPKILYHALGKATKTGTVPAVVHTITPVGRCEELPTTTWHNNICIGGTPLVRNYLGTKVDSLTISGSAGEAVEVEADLIHMSSVDGVAALASYPADLNEIMTFANGTVTINGSNVATVTEFELEIANNLEALFTIGIGNNAKMINEGVLDVTGSFTFALSDISQWTLFKNGASFDVKLKFQDPVIAANYIEINVTGAKYDTNAIQSSAEDAIEQELDVIFTDISITAGSSTIVDLTV